MRHNENRELLLKRRKPTDCNVSLANGKESVNIISNKVSQNEILRHNQQGKIYNLNQTLHECSITSKKDNLDDTSIINRIDPSTLDAFNKNPFTKSLQSYAY